jgi:hypothetical protein
MSVHVAFALKIEKLIEKAKKYTKRSDNAKLLETALDIKLEAE